MHLRAVIGGNVRGVRKAAGLQQEELAHRADVHPSYLSGIENGRRNFTIDVLDRLAQGLGVSVSSLTHRDGAG